MVSTVKVFKKNRLIIGDCVLVWLSSGITLQKSAIYKNSWYMVVCLSVRGFSPNIEHQQLH